MVTIIDRVRLLALVSLLPFCAGPAVAHDAPRAAIRELVRLQGFVTEEARSDATPVEVNGRVLHFVIEERQVFVAVNAAGASPPPEPPSLVVRGERQLLARLSSARPTQRVTLLGERRPGGKELFLAAVDRCPEGERARGPER